MQSQPQQPTFTAISIQPVRRLAEVMEDIDVDENIPHCPYTTSTPVIPYVAKTADAVRRYSTSSFEIIPLLRDLFIFDNHENPLTREPMRKNDIGTAIGPDYALIARIDELLAIEGYTRRDLLAHYGISQALYDYLLKLSYHKIPSKLLTGLNKKNLLLIWIIQILIYETIELNLLKSCKSIRDDDMYDAVKASFLHDLSFPTDFYTLKEQSHLPIMSRIAATSKVCDAIMGDIAFKAKRNLYNYFDSSQPVSTYQLPPKFAVCDALPGFIKRVHNDNGIEMSYFHFRESGDSARWCLIMSMLATYAVYNIYQQARVHKELNYFEKFSILLLMVISIVISLDAWADTFGVVSELAQLSVLRSACARACNDGFLVADIVGDKNQTFLYDSVHTDAPNNLCDTNLDRKTAAWLTLTVAPISLLAARACGMWGVPHRTKGEKEFDKLQRNEFCIKKLM